MLKIHTTDGDTIRIDLRDDTQAKEWLTRLECDDFQASISGVSLVERHATRARCPSCGAKSFGSTGVQYSVSRPQGATGVVYCVESVESEGRRGERVTVCADDVRLTLMAHASQPSARVTLFKASNRQQNGKFCHENNNL